MKGISLEGRPGLLLVDYKIWDWVGSWYVNSRRVRFLLESEG